MGCKVKVVGGIKYSRVQVELDSYLLLKIKLLFAYLYMGIMGQYEGLIEIRFDAKTRGEMCMKIQGRERDGVMVLGVSILLASYARDSSISGGCA